MKDKAKLQTKPAVDREAVRVLAIELGAREAARRLGIKESTVLSWARRHGWKLPKRKGGATLKSATAITLHSKPGDALIAAHEQLESATKTALMQALTKAAQQVAGKDALDVSNVAQLRDVCLAAARIFGWKDEPQTEVNITNQVGVVCTEEQRRRLISVREQITNGAPSMLLPESVTKSQANAGAPNSNVADDDAVSRGRSAPWSAPAGAHAPSDAGPAFRAWLEHEGPEPE